MWHVMSVYVALFYLEIYKHYNAFYVITVRTICLKIFFFTFTLKRKSCDFFSQHPPLSLCHYGCMGLSAKTSSKN